MQLFDNRIFLFRESTLIVIVAVFIAFYFALNKRLNKLRRFISAGFLTVFACIIMELSWEFASGLRWSILTPLPEWTALQAQPVMFLSYLTIVLVIVPFVYYSIRNADIAKKEVWVPLVLVACYYIVANLLSPSIYFNDYLFIGYSGASFSTAQKLVFLIPEYFLPRISFIVALLVTHAHVRPIGQGVTPIPKKE